MINEHKTPVIFTPDEIRAWPPGLESNETLATISKGKSFRINIEMYNSTDHSILLNGRTVLGRVELVESITPFEVQLQEESRSHVKAKVKTDSASVSVDVKEGIADKVKEENNDFLSQFDLSSLITLFRPGKIFGILVWRGAILAPPSLFQKRETVRR